MITAAAPFGVNALTFALAAALIAKIRPVPAPPAGSRTRLRADIAHGIRWLWGHRLLRTLAVSMGLGNVAFCAAPAVFVLYTSERLGLSGVGYGFPMITFAVFGVHIMVWRGRGDPAPASRPGRDQRHRDRPALHEAQRRCSGFGSSSRSVRLRYTRKTDARSWWPGLR
ncbi:hypothetical protein JCM9534A_02490 [Catenuloplanes indicus JCM 9534]|uniref:MFS transporter n=1 Tax=Catenuloplanes indicus TaxID=137267 RepID=A0AAE4AWW9_9ACTN|nr:hypothetical protein [Catenuloplanes indicus]